MAKIKKHPDADKLIGELLVMSVNLEIDGKAWAHKTRALSPQCISSIKTGRREPMLKTLLYMGEALGMELVWRNKQCPPQD